MRWAVWVLARTDMPREVANLGRLRSAMPELVRGKEGYGWDDARAPRVRPEGWQIDLADVVLRALVALPPCDRELVARKGDRTRPAQDIARKHGDMRSTRTVYNRRMDAANSLADGIRDALGAPWGWRALMAARDLDTDATADEALRAAWEGAQRDCKRAGQ